MTTSKHNEAVDDLVRRLEDKGRYFAVGKEVPLWKKGMLAKRGQADVLSIDTNSNRIIYWEVKTGQHYKAFKKAKRQANTFYQHMNSHPLYRTWDTQFIYYNPTHKKMRRL